MTNWQQIDPTEPWNAPRKPAVYVIYLDGVPVYVGQTNRLRLRLEQHRFNWAFSGSLMTPWGFFRGNTPILCKYRLSRRRGDWLMWEERLIWKLRPRFNIRSRPKAAA